MIRNSASATNRWDLAAAASEYAGQLIASSGYIAYQALVPYHTPVKAGNALRVPVETWLQRVGGVKARTPGTSYQQGSIGVEQFTFNAKNYGVEFPVDDEDASNYADSLRPYILATRLATKLVLDAAEMRVASLLTNGTTWTGSSLTTAIGTAWTTHSTATPIANVEGAIAKIYDLSGEEPDTVIMSHKAFRNARNCAEVLDRIKYQGNVDARAGNISASALAQAFGVSRVLVSGMPKNTSDEGQTPVIASIWGNGNVMVCKTAPSVDDLFSPSIGRSMVWKSPDVPASHEADDSPAGLVGMVTSYRNDSLSSDVIRVNHYADEQIFSTTLGHLLTGAVA